MSYNTAVATEDAEAICEGEASNDVETDVVPKGDIKVHGSLEAPVDSKLVAGHEEHDQRSFKRHPVSSSCLPLPIRPCPRTSGCYGP